jgi:hypothetical protein
MISFCRCDEEKRSSPFEEVRVFNDRFCREFVGQLPVAGGLTQ